MTLELISLAALSTTVAAIALRRAVLVVQRADSCEEVSIRPYHKQTSDCELCGQSSFLLQVKYQDGILVWTCTVCEGTYKTFTKGGK
jgi:hypothetical protein